MKKRDGLSIKIDDKIWKFLLHTFELPLHNKKDTDAYQQAICRVSSLGPGVHQSDATDIKSQQGDSNLLEGALVHQQWFGR